MIRKLPDTYIASTLLLTLLFLSADFTLTKEVNAKERKSVINPMLTIKGSAKADCEPSKGDQFNIPKDKFGLTNWVEMVNQCIIKPEESTDPDVEPIPPIELDILFKMKDGLTDNVIFPHYQHTYLFDCTNCHDEIFIPQAGANKITMAEIIQGKWCGRCHGIVAFPLADCARCHKYPKGHEIEKADTTSLRK